MHETVVGPGTYSLPGSYYRDSESVPKKILVRGRMVPLQLTVFFIILWVLESLTAITQSNLIFTVLGRVGAGQKAVIIDGLDSHLPGYLLLLSTVGVSAEQLLLQF